MFRSSYRARSAVWRVLRRASLPGALRAGLAPTIVVCGATAVQAQSTPSPLKAVLAPVVVTATRTPTRADESISEVTVIDRAAIESATGRTLPELLARQPGVLFWSNGGLCKTGAVSLRGLESRHTLLLIDGVRYGSVTAGIPIWDNLPLEAIERIEIVRGPMSGLYGSDAVGGVVQVITRRGAEGVRGTAALTAGSGRYAQAGGGVGFGQGDVEGAAQVQHTENRGFSATNAKVPFGSFNDDPDGCRQNNGSAQLGWRFGAGWRADVQALQSTSITGYDDGPGVDSRARLMSELVSLQVGGPVSGAWRSSVRLARSVDENETLASASAFASLGATRSVQQQFTWENTLTTTWGAAVLLAEHLQQEVSRPGPQYPVTDRSIHSVAAGLNGQGDVHHWQASLRSDRNSQFGTQTTGALGYGIDLASEWRAAASYGTSFVAPSFNQLYFPNFGNPDLLPEEGKHAELSLRWARAAHQVRAAYFDNRIRGYISSGPSPTNIPRTRSDGLTVSYEGQQGPWRWAASADRTRPRNVTEGSANDGKLLPRRAPSSARASADVALGAWSYGASLVAVGQRFEDAANTLPVGGYGTLDLRADWRLARGWQIGVRLNNVGGKAYETSYGYNQPGREGFVTLRYGGL
jgi:vitamin B12 transporter